MEPPLSTGPKKAIQEKATKAGEDRPGAFSLEARSPWPRPALIRMDGRISSAVLEALVADSAATRTPTETLGLTDRVGSAPVPAGVMETVMEPAPCAIAPPVMVATYLRVLTTAGAWRR